MGVTTVIKDYGTDILNAIRENDIQRFKTILEKYLKSERKISKLCISDIKHKPTKKFACPLILAARQDDPRILKYMMDRGVDPNFVHHTIYSSKRKEIVTALHISVDLGLYDSVQILLDANADCNIGDHNQETPLHIAVKKADRILVRILLSKGADPLLLDRRGNAALHIGTLYGHLQLVQTLLKYDADVYQKGQSGAIPPHIAAKEGHIHLIQLFCLRDVGNINIKIPCYADRREKAPIHLAAENGHVETIRALISQFDADVNLQDSDKNTPLHCVVLNQYNPHRMREKDDFTETARMLLKGRVAINEKNVYGDTALHLAAMNQFQRIVELLLAVGANPFLENDEHLKPIDVVPDFDPVTKQLLKNSMLGPRPPITASMDSLRKGYDLSPTPSDSQSLRRGHGIGYINTSDPNLDDERMHRTMSYVSQSTMSIDSSVFGERGLRGAGPPPPPKNPPPTSREQDLSHSQSSKSHSRGSGEDESLYNELHNQDTMPIYTQSTKSKKKTSGQQTVAPPQMSTFSQQTASHRHHSTGQQTENKRTMNMGTQPELYDDQISVVSDTSYMPSGTMTSELKRMLSKNRKQMAMYEDDASDTTSVMDTESEYMSMQSDLKRDANHPVPRPRSRSSSKPSSARQTPVMMEKPLKAHAEESPQHAEEQVYANIEYDAEGKPQVRKIKKPFLPPPRSQQNTGGTMQQQLQQEKFERMQEQMQQQIETLHRLQLQQQEINNKPAVAPKPEVILVDQHPAGIQLNTEPKKKPGSIDVQYGSGGGITLSLDTQGSQYSVQQYADGVTYLVSEDGQERVSLNDLIQQHNTAQTTQHIYLPNFRGDLSADLDDTEIESASMVSASDTQQEAVREAIQQKVVELTETRYGDATNPDISQLLQEQGTDHDTSSTTPTIVARKPRKDTPARPSLQQKQKKTKKYAKQQATQDDEAEEEVEESISPDQSPNLSPKYKNFKQALAFAKNQQEELSRQQQQEHDRLLQEQKAQQEELQEYMRHQQDQLNLEDEKQQRKVKKQSQQLQKFIGNNQSIVSTPEVKNWNSKQSSETAVVVETNQWEESPAPRQVQIRARRNQPDTESWEADTPSSRQTRGNINRHQQVPMTQHQREPRPMSQYRSSDFPSSSVEELIEDDQQVNLESDSDEDDEETEDVHPSQLQQEQLHQQSQQQHIQQLVQNAQEHVQESLQQRLPQVAEQDPGLSQESHDLYYSHAPGVSSNEAGPRSGSQRQHHPFVIQPAPIDKVSETSSFVPPIDTSLLSKTPFETTVHGNDDVQNWESGSISMLGKRIEEVEGIDIKQVSNDETIHEYSVEPGFRQPRSHSVEILGSSPLEGERLTLSPTRSMGARTPNSLCSAGSSGSGLNMRVTGEMPKAYSRATKSTARTAFIKAPPQGIESASECSDVEYTPTSPFERSSHSDYTGSPNPEVPSSHISSSQPDNYGEGKTVKKPLGAPIPPPYKTFGKIDLNIDALVEAFEQNSNRGLSDFEDEDSNEFSRSQEEIDVFSEIPPMHGSPRLIRPKPAPAKPVIHATVTTHVEEIKAQIIVEQKDSEHQPLGDAQVPDSPAVYGSPRAIRPKPTKRPRPAVKARGSKEERKDKEELRISTAPLHQDYVGEEQIQMVEEGPISREQADESVARSTFKKNIKVREDGPETFQAETLEQDFPLPVHKKTATAKEQRWQGENVIETLKTELTGEGPETRKSVVEIINSSQGEESSSSSESDDDNDDDDDSDVMKQYDYEPGLRKLKSSKAPQGTSFTAAMQIARANLHKNYESNESEDELPFAQQPVTIKKKTLLPDDPITDTPVLHTKKVVKKKLMITEDLPQMRQNLETAIDDEMAEDELFRKQLKLQAAQLSEKQGWKRGSQELHPQGMHQRGSQEFNAQPLPHVEPAIGQTTDMHSHPPVMPPQDMINTSTGQPTYNATVIDSVHQEHHSAPQINSVVPHETDIDADLDLKPSKLPSALPSHLQAQTGATQLNMSTDMADQEVAFLSEVGEKKKQAKAVKMSGSAMDSQPSLEQSGAIQHASNLHPRPLAEATAEENLSQIQQAAIASLQEQETEDAVQKSKPTRIQGRAAARKLQQQQNQQQKPDQTHIPVTVFKQHDDDDDSTSDSSDSESNSDSGAEQNISAPMSRKEAKKRYKQNKLKQIQDKEDPPKTKASTQMLPAAFAPPEKSKKAGFWSLSSMRKKKDKNVKGSQDNLSMKSGDEEASEEKPKKKGLFSKRKGNKGTSDSAPTVTMIEKPVTPEVHHLAISPERAPSSGGSEPDTPTEGFEGTVMGAATGSLLDRSDTIRESGKDKRKAGFFNLGSMRSKKKDKKKKPDQYGAMPYGASENDEAGSVQQDSKLTEHTLQKYQEGLERSMSNEKQIDAQRRSDKHIRQLQDDPQPHGEQMSAQQPEYGQQQLRGQQSQQELEGPHQKKLQPDDRTPSETNLDEVFAMEQQQQSRFVKGRKPPLPRQGSQETNLDDIPTQQSYTGPSSQQPDPQLGSDFQNASLTMMMTSTAQSQQHPQTGSHRQPKLSGTDLMSQMWAQQHQGNMNTAPVSTDQTLSGNQYEQGQLPPDVQYGQGDIHPRGKRYFKKHEKPLQPIKHINKSLEDVAFAHMKANLGNRNGGQGRNQPTAVHQQQYQPNFQQDQQRSEYFDQQEHPEHLRRQSDQEQHQQQHQHQPDPQQQEQQLQEQPQRPSGIRDGHLESVVTVQRKSNESHVDDAQHVAQMWKENQDHESEMQQILQSMSDSTMMSAGEDALRYERQYSDDGSSVNSASGIITPIQGGSSSGAPVGIQPASTSMSTRIKDTVSDAHPLLDNEPDIGEIPGPNRRFKTELHLDQGQYQHQRQQLPDHEQQQQKPLYQQQYQRQQLQDQQQDQKQHQPQYEVPEREEEQQDPQSKYDYLSEPDPRVMESNMSAAIKETQQQAIKEQETNRSNAPSPKPSVPKKPSHLKWGTAGGKPKIAVKPAIGKPKVQMSIEPGEENEATEAAMPRMPNEELITEGSVTRGATGTPPMVTLQHQKHRNSPEDDTILSEVLPEADRSHLQQLTVAEINRRNQYGGTPEVVDMDSFNVRAPVHQAGGAVQFRPRWQEVQQEQELPEGSPVKVRRKKARKQNEDMKQKEFMSDTEVGYGSQTRKRKNISFEDNLHSEAEVFDMELPLRDTGKTLQEAAMESITANLTKTPPRQKPRKPWWQESEQPLNYTRGVYRPQNIRFRPSTGDAGSGRYDDSLIQSRPAWSDHGSNHPTGSEGEADTEEYPHETSFDVGPIRRQTQKPPEYYNQRQQQQYQYRLSQMSMQSNDSVFDPPHISPTHSNVSSSKRVTIVEGTKEKKKKKKKRDKPPSIMEPGPVDFSQYPVTARLWMEQVDKKTVQKSKTMSFMVMPDGMQPPEELRQHLPHYESTSDDVFLPPQWVIARGRTLRKKSKQCSSSASLSWTGSGPESETEGQPERPMSPGRQILLFFRVGSNWRDLAWILFDGIYNEAETLKLIKDIQLKHEGDLSQQVRDLMHRWWKKKKSDATVEELQRALDVVNLGYIKEDFDQRNTLLSFTDTEDDLDITEVSDTDPDVTRLIGEYQVRSLNASFDCENAVNPQYNLPLDQMNAGLSQHRMLQSGYSRNSLGHRSTSSSHPTHDSNSDTLPDDGDRKFLIVTPQLKHADYRHETTI